VAFVPEPARFLALTLAEIRMLEQLRTLAPQDLGKLPAPVAIAVREYLEKYASAHETGERNGPAKA
jgi:hypothetical protein